MDYQRHTCRLLDDEHRANLQLLGDVERALHGRGAETAITPLASALARMLEHEIGRHFDFEEYALFPHLAEAGDGDLAELLTEEHRCIREVAAELLPLARAAAAGPLTAERFGTLRRLTLELTERLVGHIQKETMGLLPILDDMLDETTDRRLAFEYTETA